MDADVEDELNVLKERVAVLERNFDHLRESLNRLAIDGAVKDALAASEQRIILAIDGAVTAALLASEQRIIDRIAAAERRIMGS